MRYGAALLQSAHEDASNHLLQHVRRGRKQEDLCFALWRPSAGKERFSALIFEIVKPVDGERSLHGNTSFLAKYLTRVIKLACSKNAGVAFMHNHLDSGWQDMSRADVVAEKDRIAHPCQATGLPLVGLTLGTDEAWSARFWIRTGKKFERCWCESVRIVGAKLKVTFNDARIPPYQRRNVLRRTIDTWGIEKQNQIARLRVGIVGQGSVGCLVAENLARMGVRSLILFDHDRVEEHNLDRLLFASSDDVGLPKVKLAERHLKRSATADAFSVIAHIGRIQETSLFKASLDCDVLFCAVDRPMPKDLLNHIAYAHCIPVIFGGVHISNKLNGELAQATWGIAAAGPQRRCLRCDGQYTSSDVVLENDGSLDNPSYVQNRHGFSGGMPANQNVFPFCANLASFMVIELIRMVAGEAWWSDMGGKTRFSLIPNSLIHEKGRCADHCSVSSVMTLGDGFSYPFLREDKDQRVSICKAIGQPVFYTCRAISKYVSKIFRKHL